jgi:hypothetical protein
MCLESKLVRQGRCGLGSQRQHVQGDPLEHEPLARCERCDELRHPLRVPPCKVFYGLSEPKKQLLLWLMHRELGAGGQGGPPHLRVAVYGFFIALPPRESKDLLQKSRKGLGRFLRICLDENRRACGVGRNDSPSTAFGGLGSGSNPKTRRTIPFASATHPDFAKWVANPRARCGRKTWYRFRRPCSTSDANLRACVAGRSTPISATFAWTSVLSVSGRFSRISTTILWVGWSFVFTILKGRVQRAIAGGARCPRPHRIQGVGLGSGAPFP